MIILKILPSLALSILFTLIFIGGYVSASGLGLSCPQWPLCPSGLAPQRDYIIEYAHRSIAMLLALLVLATMAFTLKSKIAPRGMKLATAISAGAAIGQITLGGIVIIERLHAILVTAHLGLGLVLLSMLVMTVVYVSKLPKRVPIATSRNAS